MSSLLKNTKTESSPMAESQQCVEKSYLWQLTEGLAIPLKHNIIDSDNSGLVKSVYVLHAIKDASNGRSCASLLIAQPFIFNFLINYKVKCTNFLFIACNYFHILKDST